MPRPLYVETLVSCELETLWWATQDAAAHTRWDLRFSRIDDVTAQDSDGPRRFRYSLRLPGVTVSGTGTSVGEHVRPDGTRTSALRFASPHPLGLLRRGSGWWRYVPTTDGTRFLTGYDYAPAWGAFGRAVDRLGLRRWLGWATAWSFDRLRLWVDEGVAPEAALRRALADAALRAAALGSAAVAVREARRERTGAAAVVGAVVLGTAAVLAPPVPGAPRAGRCLRQPPDARSSRPPSTLSRLEAPA